MLGFDSLGARQYALCMLIDDRYLFGLLRYWHAEIEFRRQLRSLRIEVRVSNKPSPCGFWEPPPPGESLQKAA